MRTIVICDLDTEFMVQGLGLHPCKPVGFTGKLGRQELFLYNFADISQAVGGETQIILLGSAQVEGTRAGDFLMAGNKELLDRVFKALDEIEQRAIVVRLTASEDPSLVYLPKDTILEQIQKWKSEDSPYLALFVAEPVDLEAKAKLVALVRKMISTPDKASKQ